MSRMTERQYRRRTSLAALAYLLAMLLVWPLARGQHGMLLKGLLALVPAVPMLYLMVQMAARIRASDELEQRVHMQALGMACGVVCAASLIGGLLAAAGALRVQGDILVWVFPLIMSCYGLGRWWLVTRHYGGSTGCEDGSDFPLYQRLLVLAGLIAIILAVCWWRGQIGPLALGMLVGMLLVLLPVAVYRLLRRRRSGVA